MRAVPAVTALALRRCARLRSAAAALPTSPVPPLTGRVVDQTGTLSRSDVAALSQKLQRLRDAQGQPDRRADRADDAARRRSSSSRSASPRPGRSAARRSTTARSSSSPRTTSTLRIEVGYGLEGALTDVTARRIIDEVITPKFRSGDFAGGIAAGVDRMIGVIDGEPLPAPQPQASNCGNLDDIGPICSSGHAVRLVRCIGRRFCARLFGRLLGSVGDRRCRSACSAWFMLGSIALALLAGIVGFVIAFIADGLPRRSTARAVARRLVVERLVVGEAGAAVSRRATAAASAAVAAVLAAAAPRGAGERIMSIERIARHLLQHHWRREADLPPKRARRASSRPSKQSETHAFRPGPLRRRRRARRPRRCSAISRRASARSTCSRNCGSGTPRTTTAC